MKSIHIQTLTKRLIKSPFVLLCMLLIGADFIVFDFKIKEEEKLKSNLASNESRIPALRDSIQNGRKSDVLLLGSSLVVTAFTYPDFKLGLAPLNQYDDGYTQARLLSSLIEQKTGKSVDAVNLSCLAATPADALLIVSELEKRNKLPQTVVYGIEPRDVADNLTPVGGALGGTAALDLEPQYHHPNFLQKAEIVAYKAINSVLPREVKSGLDDLKIKLARLGENPATDEVNEIVASHFWQLFSVRKQIGDQAQERASAIFKAKSKSKTNSDTVVSKRIKVECVAQDNSEISSSSDNKPWDTVSAKRIQTQLEQYKGHYLPCNKSKIEKNLALLDRLAQVCHKNGAKLYLVKMPLTRENSSLVPAETARGYDASLKAVADRYQCKLVDLRDGFDHSDFMDTVHLNAQGGEKLQKKLVSALDCSIQ